MFEEKVNNINDIKNNIITFILIGNEKIDSEIIKKFNNFLYWYYFPLLEIFVPNLFLGYKDCAFNPYPAHPLEDYAMDGGDAQKVLNKYFNNTCGEKLTALKKKLKIFIKDKFKKDINIEKDIKILELNDKYSHICNEIDLENISKNQYYDLYKKIKVENINTKPKSNTKTDKKHRIEQKKINKQTICQLEIDKFGIINVAFRKILPSLAKKVCDTLKEKDNKNWWKKYVIDKLQKNAAENLPQNGNFEECKSRLDIQACLNIIEYNWMEIFKDFFTKNGKKYSSKKYFDWVKSLKTTRNDYDAHYTIHTIESFDDNDLKRELENIACFMEPIDMSVSKQIRSIKDNIY